MGIASATPRISPEQSTTAQSQREMRKSTTWNKVEQYLDSLIGILPYLRSVFAALLLPAPKRLAVILFNRI